MNNPNVLITQPGESRQRPKYYICA
uniref:Uncharacterized protein n=1 Tax=Anguilla anguilla TaxID=7936 RepID=A0A0E9W3E2_ANGAN